MKKKLLNLFNTVANIFFKQQKIFLTSSLQFLTRKEIFAKDSFDYIRLATLELLVKEIKEKNVPGNVAELGVYQGEFSKYVNQCFPDRKLYLFDTFKGFDKNDIKTELENRFSSGDQDFSNTSVELVMGKMKFPEQCIVKKGFFPDTAEGLEDSFALVSLDTDLFDPIYYGLCYFYPRLNPGGYILVHDYNSEGYKGVKEAVRKFCWEQNINFIPIPDSAGSGIISR